ncbi:MAG: ABC transporter ATP-binding protein [Mollicutes bacterium]|nr:ABC transporter ATP-binding protein [Mollicutes bacterium]MDD7264021.1 ABC transporter ATP-binding protein [bacterium]
MLKVENLSKHYEIDNGNNVVILNNITINFPNSGIVFVLGKSGSGKTTLLNILESLLRPTSGSVFYDDKDLYKSSNNDLLNYRKKNIGILFQNYNLLDNLTVLENLVIFEEIHDIKQNRILDLLNQVGLGHKVNSLIDTLSGGEKQRISFVRSIIHEPNILFCDEPTGALDPINGSLLLKYIKEYSQNHLVIFVTHNEQLIDFSKDRFIRIKNGKVYEQKNF